MPGLGATAWEAAVWARDPAPSRQPAPPCLSPPTPTPLPGCRAGHQRELGTRRAPATHMPGHLQTLPLAAVPPLPPHSRGAAPQGPRRAPAAPHSAHPVRARLSRPARPAEPAVGFHADASAFAVSVRFRFSFPFVPRLGETGQNADSPSLHPPKTANPFSLAQVPCLVFLVNSVPRPAGGPSPRFPPPVDRAVPPWKSSGGPFSVGGPGGRFCTDLCRRSEQVSR